jgi:hypothetical protein
MFWKYFKYFFNQGTAGFTLVKPKGIKSVMMMDIVPAADFRSDLIFIVGNGDVIFTAKIYSSFK